MNDEEYGVGRRWETAEVGFSFTCIYISLEKCLSEKRVGDWIHVWVSGSAPPHFVHPLSDMTMLKATFWI